MRYLTRYFDLSHNLRKRARVKDYLLSIFVAALATLIVWFAELATHEKFSNITSLFVLSVLYCAIYLGRGPGILNAMLCTFLFDYLFVPPLFSATNNLDNTIKFTVFLLAAIMASWIAGKARDYALSLKEKEQRIRLMHLLTERLLNARDEAALAGGASAVLAEELGLHASIVLLHESEEETTALARPLDIPLRTAVQHYGWLRLLPRDNAVQDDLQSLLPILAGHIAMNLERLRLRREKEEALMEKERESLRAALYCSVSHDLKTPLASIIGAATTLKATEGKLPLSDQQILIATIHAESERLHHFVNNILESAKLEHHPALLKREPVDIDDVLDRAIKKMPMELGQHRLLPDLPPDLPLLNADPDMLEVVLANILNNAAKFSPPGTAIRIAARQTPQGCMVTIDDAGPGIPEDERAQVFDKFHRIRQQDQRIAGTGLGLYICQKIIEAHGGTITAASTPEGKGCRIALLFPPAMLLPCPILAPEADAA